MISGLQFEKEQLLHPRGVSEDNNMDAFASCVEDRKKFVIFGAGQLGHRCLNAARAHDLDITAIIDNNPKLWGREESGVPIMSPQDAASKLGNDTVPIIAIFHPCLTSDVRAAERQLRELGWKTIFTFPHLTWRYPADLLPNFYWSTPQELRSHAGELDRVFDLLADDLSRDILLRALQVRLLADFAAADNADPSPQYFSNVYSLLSTELFVDCGAYDGDTVASFVTQTGGLFRGIVAFEADPENAARLRRKIAELGIQHSTVVEQAAVGGSNGSVRFAAEGNSSAGISAHGESIVACVTLDHKLENGPITLLKMDIEGAEWDAIGGAAKTIARDRPVSAICLYHCPDDLWRIPLRLSDLVPDSRLYLRSYSAEGFELVCYCVPKERTSSKVVLMP
jgi:FkbM family methyltransferase